MKYIKLFETFINESTHENIVNHILTALTDDIQHLIGKHEEAFEKHFERQMTDYDKELTRLNIIWDMVKSIETYTLPSDALITITSAISNKGNLEISAKIQRDDQVYNFNTEVIYAGGHNIQKLHYRYLTKTNLPKTGSNTISSEYSAKIKSLSKLEKLNNEIESNLRVIQRNSERVNDAKRLSDDDIFNELKKDDINLTVTWEDIVNRGAEKNFKSRQDWQKSHDDYIKNKIEFWKTKNIKWTEDHSNRLQIQINQTEKKIKNLIG
jgi:hypothetical protein